MWKTIYLKDYKKPNFLVEKIDLNFDLYDDKTIVSNKAIYYKDLDLENNDYSLSLDWQCLKLIWIFVEGRELIEDEYFFEENKLVIKKVPTRFELEIITEIHPETNTELEWLYMSNWMFCTQCEAEWFRRITYYQDRPDVMTKFTVKITADKSKYPVLLSNWNKIESRDLPPLTPPYQWGEEEFRHSVTWEDPFKKPAYLFALVAWNLEFIEDKFITMTGREITLKIFTSTKNISRCDFAMESLKKAMKWDEDTFWLEYDLDLFMIVAVDDFNSWAMENKWLNIFNSQAILALPETTTDAEYIYIERVVAHEYFHNWTWDRVTCRDWFQLSLKEWLTVYRDARFTWDMHSKAVKKIEDVKYLKDYQFKEDASPISHPIRPNSYEEIRNFYTVTVYEKWAQVIWIYETLLWKEWFRKWMDLYFKRHDWQAVTTEDFLSAMWDANEIDLSQMQTWYDQAWTPIVNVKSEYDEKAKTFKIIFEQKISNEKPFIIPIKYAFIDKVTKEIINEGMFILKDFIGEFVFENVPNDILPSLLRDFSAPVILNYNYSNVDYLDLIKYETDEFNRFEAFQKFALDLIISEINSPNENNFETLKWVFEVILNDTALDISLKAETIILPSESFIISTIWENINPELIVETREKFIKYLAKTFEKEFENIYNELNILSVYKVEAKDIWERKLKNACLNYLSYVKDSELAYNQYKNSNNMTDTIGALKCLVNTNSKEKDLALEDFYEKWKDDNNVFTKWFSVQALSRNSSALENIKLLEKHPKFDIKNPNYVRALFNSFAMLNLGNFHKSSWEWYEFIADKVIEIDSFNSQIAARLSKTLINWKSLEPKRWELLKKQLEKIREVPNLSPDTSEVINKAL